MALSEAKETRGWAVGRLNPRRRRRFAPRILAARNLPQRGFTLLELMVVMALFSLIAYVIFVSMRLGNDQIQTSELKMTIESSARESLHAMLQELRASAPDRIAIGAANDTVQFNVPDPNNALVAGSYTINWPGHRIEYTLAGLNNRQIIKRNLTTNETSVLANDVVSLNFSGNRTSPTVVTVTLGVQRTLINGRAVPAQPLELAGQAAIRNR